jgi:glycosyltransferase involved in cell wall biosynthesis
VNQQRRARPLAGTSESVTLPSVLVMTHSHPKLTRGGAEISADALFEGLRARGAAAWFLGVGGAGSEARLGAALTQPFGADDYLYSPAAPFDYFKFANPDAQFPAALAELVGRLAPDIVHAHHYTRFGVECFGVIRRASPATRIVLSLHEYLAICHNNGQMVKTGSRHLCAQATPTACAQCFPERAARDFFLRDRYIRTFLEDVDLFLAPSRFLAGRYAEWGLPADRILVLENMPPRGSVGGDMGQKPPAASLAADALFGASEAARLDGRQLRFGFFGQLSPMKGLPLLVEAAGLLQAAGVETVRFEVFGDYSNQPLDYQAETKAAMDEAGRNLVFHGRYDNADVRRLMSRVDAVIVPSIWWENSPLVIQEAFSCGKPVICSNIGGMAEKVRDGVDGLHFEAGRPRHLAHVLAGLAARPEILDRIAGTVGRPPDASAALDAHLAAYARVLGPRNPAR